MRCVSFPITLFVGRMKSRLLHLVANWQLWIMKSFSTVVSCASSARLISISFFLFFISLLDLTRRCFVYLGAYSVFLSELNYARFYHIIIWLAFVLFFFEKNSTIRPNKHLAKWLCINVGYCIWKVEEPRSSHWANKVNFLNTIYRIPEKETRIAKEIFGNMIEVRGGKVN